MLNNTNQALFSDKKMIAMVIKFHQWVYQPLRKKFIRFQY